MGYTMGYAEDRLNEFTIAEALWQYLPELSAVEGIVHAKAILARLHERVPEEVLFPLSKEDVVRLISIGRYQCDACHFKGPTWGFRADMDLGAMIVKCEKCGETLLLRRTLGESDAN